MDVCIGPLSPELKRRMDQTDSIIPNSCIFNHIRRAAVVDDNLQVQTALANFLQDMQIEAEVWPNGVPPSQLDIFDPDLIILDVALGVSDAFAILRSQIPPSYRGVVSIVSGKGIDVVMDVMLLGERLGFRMGKPTLKPFNSEDIWDLVSAADELLERRSIGEWAMGEQAAAPASRDLRLRQALDEGLLEVWYQPKLEVATGLVAGAEALIRARAPDGEIITPYILLRDAAKEDMLRLTDYVLTKVVKDSGPLASLGFSKKLSVNVPASYLMQDDPCRIVRKAKILSHWPGLIFEITEDEALHDVVDVQMIATQLKLYSVSLSIDDFGAAYSSLSRLRDLPFTELKLDRSFVHHCSTDSKRRSICASVLALGAELGLNTVAEGVEDVADMHVLSELGCDQVQGYIFASIGDRVGPAVLFRAGHVGTTARCGGIASLRSGNRSTGWPEAACRPALRPGPWRRPCPRGPSPARLGTTARDIRPETPPPSRPS